MRTVNFEDLSSLRPNMSTGDLKHALGDFWTEPDKDLEGRFFSLIPEYGFGVRLDKNARIGELHFHNKFPYHIAVEGIHIGMPLYEVQDQFSHMQFQVEKEQGVLSRTRYSAFLPSGFELEIIFFKDQVDMFCLRDKEAEYPDVFTHETKLKTAYDLAALPAQVLKEHSGRQWQNGWLLGRPPGLLSAQWPLSYKTGYPLRHAFTLKLPQAYRVYSAEHVALSLFVEDHGEYVVPSSLVDLAQIVTAFEKDKVPEVQYQFLWQHALVKHPHSFRVSDLSGREYVLLWRTESEFMGPLYDPPHLENETLLLGVSAPSWLKLNSQSYFKSLYFFDKNGLPLKYLDTDVLGMAFPIEVLERDADPNVGLPPSESQVKSYVPMFSSKGITLGLDRWAGKTHLGGTMGALLSPMRLSPYYLELEGHFGGIHKGEGVGQIDLKLMRVDWSCG